MDIRHGKKAKEQNQELEKRKKMFAAKRKIRFREPPNEILIRCLAKDDLTEWNKWRVDNESVHISLRGSFLSNVNLAGTDLSRVDLKAVDLKNTDLEGADLSEANLNGADLSHANLSGTNLWKANLKFARLRRANLKSAQLVMANLENAELIGSNLESADLWKANLKGTKLISVTADRRTFIWGCDFNEQTVVRGKNLSIARIAPRLMKHMNNV
jgi:uncharacterized protein YjbI with pentapeptide repeats